MTPAPDYPALAARTRREIAAFDFRPREAAILHLILRLSYERARPYAFFQHQGQLGDILGISKGNVSALLKRLTCCGVLHIEPALGRYHIQPDTELWRIAPLYRTPSHRAAAERLEAMLANLGDQDQLHLLPPLPDLDLLLLEDAAARTAPPSPGPINAARAASEPAPVSGPRGDTDTQHTSEASDSGDALSRLIARSLAQYDEPPDEPPQRPPHGSQIGNSVPKSGTPSLRELKEETSSLIKESLNERRGAHRLVIPRCPPAPDTEREILALLADIAPPAEVSRYGGFWRLAARWRPVEARDALHDARRRKREGLRLRPGGTWGGLARALFEDFTGARKPHWKKDTFPREGERERRRTAGRAEEPARATTSA